jgi:hypothetical protein
MLILGLAIGTAAAIDVANPGVAKAQGFAIDAPGVHVRVGERHRYRYYYDNGTYDGYGAYDYAGPRRYYGNYGNYGCPPHYTVQDGVCKPYRGY